MGNRFAQNICGTIAVSIDDQAAMSLIPSSADSPARKRWFPFNVSINRDRIVCGDIRFGGIALLLLNDGDAGDHGFVSNHLPKLCMRNTHKVLIIPFSHISVLLPELVCPDHQNPNAVLNSPFDDSAADFVHHIVLPAIMLQRQTGQML